VLIDTNLAVAIKPDNSVVGIWRKCENTADPQCSADCCTFPHLLTASNWKDPSTYYPHSDKELFPEVKAYGSEDPMLWLAPPPKQLRNHDQGHGGIHQAENDGSDLVVHAILHDEQVH
jgi:hypothetical protein